LSEITDILTKYQPYIQQVFGNFADISAKRSYKEALDDLKRMQEERDKIQRFKGLMTKLKDVSLDETDMYKWDDAYKKQADMLTQSTDKPFVQDLLQGVKYYDKDQNEVSDILRTGVGPNGNAMIYSRAGKDAEGNMKLFDDDAEAIKNALEQNNYMGFNNMDEAKEFLSKAPEVMQGKGKVQLSEDEQRAKLFQKAGFLPEDMQLYNEYKDKVNAVREYNQKLVDMIYSREGALSSEGTLGDRLAKMFERRVAAQAIDEPAYKLEFDHKGGKMIWYDTSDPSNYQIIQYKQPETSEKKLTGRDFPDMDRVELDKDGKPYYYADVYDPVTNTYKQQFLRYLSEEEKKKYQNATDKMNKAGIYAPKGRSGVKGRSGTRRSVSKMTADELKTMTADEIKELDVYNLKEIQDKYYDLLTPEQQKAVDEAMGTAKDEQEGTPQDSYNDVDDADLDAEDIYDNPKGSYQMDEDFDERALDRAEDMKWLQGERTKIAEITGDYLNDMIAVANDPDLSYEESANEIEAFKQEAYEWIGENLFDGSYPQEIIDETYAAINKAAEAAYGKIQSKWRQ